MTLAFFDLETRLISPDDQLPRPVSLAYAIDDGPVELMRWLLRLLVPPGGVALDPFGGSGTTGIAAAREGFHAVLIEREDEYVEIARARIAHATKGT